MTNIQTKVTAIAATLFSVVVFQNASVHAATLFNNLDLGEPDNTLQATESDRPLAQQFKLGDHNAITSLTSRIRRDGFPVGGVSFELWDDSGSDTPGNFIGEIVSIPDAQTIPIPGSDITFDSVISGLTPNEEYWVVLNYSDLTFVEFGNSIVWATYQSDEGTNGAAKATGSRDGGASWLVVSEVLDNPSWSYFGMSVEGATIPEPASIFGLVTLGTLGLGSALTKHRDSSHKK